MLRYTLAIEPDVYVSKATDVLKGLEAKGYTVVKFKNMWNGDTYKGLSTKIKIPDGIVFELQMHTPESYVAAKETHPYYEIARDKNSTEEEVAKATSYARDYYANLEIPEGALEFKWE